MSLNSIISSIKKMKEVVMQKASLIGAIILSSILPGAGLLLVQKGGWFAAYLVLGIIGVIMLFFFGLGIIIIIPVWIVSFIHTVVAVRKHNSLVTVT
jgi:hypothetical protein